MDLEYYSITGWFLLGLMTGLGPCLAHQLFILLPCLGMTQGKKRRRVALIAAFTIGRAGMYVLLGFFAGLLGFVFLSAIGHDGLYIVTQLVLGSLLIFLALTVLFKKEQMFNLFIFRFSTSHTGHAMLLVGALTALTPCPILFGLFTYTAATGHIFQGMLNGFAFAVGTSVVPLIAGLSLTMLENLRKKIPRLSSIIQPVSGLILFGYGLHLLLHTVLHFR